MKENKLIAEFMGYKFYNNLPQQRNGYQLPKDKGTAIYLAYSTSELQYHTSWDWLMTVVEKIYEIAVDDENIEVFYEVSDNLPDRHETYKSVVEFIKKYNKNKRDESND